MTVVHYGTPGYRPACGQPLPCTMTRDRSQATCLRCPTTLQWERRSHDPKETDVNRDGSPRDAHRRADPVPLIAFGGPPLNDRRPPESVIASTTYEGRTYVICSVAMLDLIYVVREYASIDGHMVEVGSRRVSLLVDAVEMVTAAGATL